MAVAVGNGRVGPCGVFTGVSYATDLGGTKDPSVVGFSFDHQEITFEQTGTKAVDLVRTGFEAILKSSIGEVANRNALLLGFPGDEIVGDESSWKIELNGNIGQQALRDSLTTPVQLRPYAGGIPSTDPRTYITAPKGYFVVDGDAYAVGLGGQVKLGFQIRCLPDTGNNNVRLIIGDPDAT